LTDFIDKADYVAVNDYEAQQIQSATGHTLSEQATRVKALVETKGAEGSVIYAQGKRFQISAVRPQKIVDPTGCGDAYRAGLLYGIAQGMDWQITGQLASLMGTLKIAHRGGQNHQYQRDEIDQ